MTKKPSTITACVKNGIEDLIKYADHHDESKPTDVAVRTAESVAEIMDFGRWSVDEFDISLFEGKWEGIEIVAVNKKSQRRLAFCIDCNSGEIEVQQVYRDMKKSKCVVETLPIVTLKEWSRG